MVFSMFACRTILPTILPKSCLRSDVHRFSCETCTFSSVLYLGQRLEPSKIVCQLWSLMRKVEIGTSLAALRGMKFFCRHCDEIVVGKPYRVISEEDGVILLDMTVCRSCYEQARALGLSSEALPLEHKPHRHHRRPSAFAPSIHS